VLDAVPEPVLEVVVVGEKEIDEVVVLLRLEDRLGVDEVLPDLVEVIDRDVDPLTEGEGVFLALKDAERLLVTVLVVEGEVDFVGDPLEVRVTLLEDVVVLV
jgi:hypothetical protein